MLKGVTSLRCGRKSVSSMISRMRGSWFAAKIHIESRISMGNLGKMVNVVRFERFEDFCLFPGGIFWNL